MCDWSKPGIGQQAAVSPLTFAAGPGGVPLPAAPVASTPGAAGDKAAAEADDAGAQKAENEPVLTEQQAAKGGAANIRGEGAPKITAPGTTATPATKQ